MFRDLLGLVADITGIVFVWWQPNDLPLIGKVLISCILVALSIGILVFSQDRSKAKVKDYFAPEGEPITLILNKNANYCDDMLVSVYIKEETVPSLCAIGYVTKDPRDKKLHIRVIHDVDKNAILRIKQSRKYYRHYFVKPSVMQADISAIYVPKKKMEVS